MIYWSNNLLSSHSLVNVLNFTSISGLQNEFIHTITLVVLYEHKHKLDLADIVASAQLRSQSFSTPKLLKKDHLTLFQLQNCSYMSVLHYPHHAWTTWGWYRSATCCTILLVNVRRARGALPAASLHPADKVCCHWSVQCYRV